MTNESALLEVGDLVWLNHAAKSAHPLIPSGCVLRVSRLYAPGVVDCRWPCPGSPAGYENECERRFAVAELIPVGANG